MFQLSELRRQIPHLTVNPTEENITLESGRSLFHYVVEFLLRAKFPNSVIPEELIVCPGSELQKVRLEAEARLVIVHTAGGLVHNSFKNGK